MPRPKQSRDVATARALRRGMSLPERLLWAFLRNSPDGVKFRRQHPLGPYVVDFFCAEAGVCIEIDGIAHDMGDNPGRDARRDAWLGQQSLEVVRVPAVDVLNDPVAVAEALVRYCQR